MRKIFPVSIYLALLINILIAVSCSNSREPASRREQERMFGELFDFGPPEGVREIRYKDLYNRHLMNGSWGRWIAFTYNQETFRELSHLRFIFEVTKIPLKSKDFLSRGIYGTILI